MLSEQQPEERIVTCSACEGDGGWEVAETGRYGYLYDPRDGALITSWRECGACGGEGRVSVEVHPIDFDDIAAIPSEPGDDPYCAFAYRGGNP